MNDTVDPSTYINPAPDMALAARIEGRLWRIHHRQYGSMAIVADSEREALDIFVNQNQGDESIRNGFVIENG